MAKTDNTDYLNGLYEDMSLEELKDDIIKNLKRIKATELEKKDYNASIKEVIDDLKERIDILIYWVGVKETEKERAELEAAAEKALTGSVK